MKTNFLTIPESIARLQADAPKPMLAYHGSKELKRFYVGRVKAHREADELIKGTYWEGGKGCAVGCSIHSSEHSAYEAELGIPQALARIEDWIFEGLDNGHAQAWPGQFLSAITVGADLCRVKDHFLHWLLVDPKDGVLRFVKLRQAEKLIELLKEAPRYSI